MSFDLKLITSDPSRMFLSDTSDTPTHINTSEQSAVQNASHPDGCLTVIFSDMEFIPWDNPDNIVTADVEHISRRVKDFVIVFWFLIGGPGNVINMAVFYKQGLKDRVNLCLFALSLADELYLIIMMCHHAEQVHLQFTTKELYGPMITFLINNYLTGLMGFLYVSSVLTAIVASERCYCVLRPLKYQTLMSTRTMTAFIILVYIVAVGLYFIVAFRFHVGCIYDPVSGMVIKTQTPGEMYTRHKELVDNVDNFFFGAGLPSVMMLIVITATIVTVAKLRQIVTWRSEASSSISTREVALTKMLVGTSVLFIVCTLPLAVTRISWQFLPEVNAGRRHHNFFLTSIWVNEILMITNSSFNIFVYYAMGSRYRETLQELFCRKPRSRTEKGHIPAIEK